MGVVGQRHAPAALPPRMTRCIEGWVGLRTVTKWSKQNVLRGSNYLWPLCASIGPLLYYGMCRVSEDYLGDSGVD